MITSLRIGGHSDHLDDPGVRELLELALTDQLAAGLFSRFLRGDRSVTGQLYERMVALRPDPWVGGQHVLTTHRSEDPFTCTSCFLVEHRSQLHAIQSQADGHLICNDCAD